MKQVWEKRENSTLSSYKLEVLFNPLDEYVILPVLVYDQISDLFNIRQAVFAMKSDDRRGTTVPRYYCVTVPMCHCTTVSLCQCATSHYALWRMHSSFNFKIFFRRHFISELDQMAEILKKTWKVYKIFIINFLFLKPWSNCLRIKMTKPTVP